MQEHKLKELRALHTKFQCLFKRIAAHDHHPLIESLHNLYKKLSNLSVSLDRQGSKEEHAIEPFLLLDGSDIQMVASKFLTDALCDATPLRLLTVENKLPTIIKAFPLQLLSSTISKEKSELRHMTTIDLFTGETKEITRHYINQQHHGK